MENKEVIDDSQHDFTKGKSNLANLLFFYSGVAVLVDKGRATDIIYLVLCKAFDAVLYNSPVCKLEGYRFDGWTSWQIRIWLDNHTPKSCGQCPISKWSDKWCSSEISIGTCTVLHLCKVA